MKTSPHEGELLLQWMKELHRLITFSESLTFHKAKSETVGFYLKANTNCFKCPEGRSNRLKQWLELCGCFLLLLKCEVCTTSTMNNPIFNHDYLDKSVVLMTYTTFQQGATLKSQPLAIHWHSDSVDNLKRKQTAWNQTWFKPTTPLWPFTLFLTLKTTQSRRFPFQKKTLSPDRITNVVINLEI